MQEYVSDALVLRKTPHGESDDRVVFFTKKFGKVSARAKSSRKITSKLSAHIEPGNMVRVRLIEKNGFQLTDALKERRIGLTPPTFHFLDRLLAEMEPDPHLWQILTGDAFSWIPILRLLGWDPLEGRCQVCAQRPVSFFDVRSQEFFCDRCASNSRIPGNELLCITLREIDR